MYVVQCDTCAKRYESHRQAIYSSELEVGWIIVEADGKRFHFCSRDCVRNWKGK